MTISYHGIWLGLSMPFLTGNVRNPRRTIMPMNTESLISGRVVRNTASIMQYRENAVISMLMISLGFPVHTLTFDSLSYFFITASTSAAVPMSTASG